MTWGVDLELRTNCALYWVVLFHRRGQGQRSEIKHLYFINSDCIQIAIGKNVLTWAMLECILLGAINSDNMKISGKHLVEI